MRRLTVLAVAAAFSVPVALGTPPTPSTPYQVVQVG